VKEPLVRQYLQRKSKLYKLGHRRRRGEGRLLAARCEKVKFTYSHETSLRMSAVIPRRQLILARNQCSRTNER
jgi:hypothetical protein